MALGLEYLRSNRPVKTYSMGCALLALEAAQLDRDRPLMEAILADLLATQGQSASDGRTDQLWSYPGTPAKVVDLSNTQYAALGLWAAHRAGIEVPKKAWIGLVTDTLRYQERPREVVPSVYVGTRDEGESFEEAGFSYRVREKPTGSMTSAGLAILAIGREGLGDDLSRGLARKLDESEALALAWLGRHFSVEQNPGKGDSWHDYYLYGLERVGALFGLTSIGGREWYWEGAQNLLRRQKGDGSWKDQPATLLRAPVPGAGHRPAQRRPPCRSPLHLRAEGQPGALSGHGPGQGHLLADRLLRREPEQAGGQEPARPAHREGRVPGGRPGGRNPARQRRRAVEGRALRLPARLSRTRRVPRDGARDPVHRRRGRGGQGDDDELVSHPMQLKLGERADPARLAYPRHGADNLLHRTKLEIEASSFNVDGQKPDRTVDGLHGTYWCAKKDDAEPQLELTLARAQKGNTLLLSHVNLHARGRDDHDRARRVRVWINRLKEPFELEMPANDAEKGVLRLEKTVALRQLRLEILSRDTGDAHPGFVGFSEIEWLLEP